MPVKNRLADMQPQIAEWRQDIHAHPELLFEVHRTAKKVADLLREFGCDEVVEGIGRTGVVGVIKGRQTVSGRTIGLRADMDALPILEETGAEYASTNAGVMHACGHDGHTSMLLGAAQYLAETRNFDGTCVVIFQPAEEGGGGGLEMCKDGMMSRWNIDEVYGMHNWPGQPLGQFAIRTGPFFAATDQFTIKVEGKGGHAAKPHEAIDSTVVASHLVVALQTIAARNVDPTEQIVVSVTSFETSSKAHNVLPQFVDLRGTVRSLDKDVRLQGQRRVEAIAAGIAATFGAEITVDYELGYPVMVNHARETQYAIEAATKVAGSCDHAPLVMGGEDFAYMLEERPGAYILVGNGDSAPVHHPKFNFNDEILPIGASWYAEMVESRLPVA
ncbi:hippurate hydrolase [Pacificibacter maritimus]|uniref:Hippurate hydrolase n=1 Tax=Pacificibacter maritimus TaxID=762213 RepID=A0A3N4UK88_9RHOB|nr:M20 aminoacylase family protein [Pacificibacter maritimus]RPE71076.1 hippurate hydrolase [Pacificibacter maritimus]